MNIDLDAPLFTQAGEGSLRDDAKICSVLAENLIRWQIKNPNSQVTLTGSKFEYLAHLAQLESWTGLNLVSFKLSSGVKNKLVQHYFSARKAVSELGPLSQKEWSSFITRLSTATDIDFLAQSYDVSIIVPCYKPSAFVKQFAKSAASWSGFVREILVVSDGNTPDENQLLENDLGAIKNCTVYTRDENKGPGFARNYGIEQASGEYLSFLDFDDHLDPDLLPILLKAAIHSGENLFCSHLLKIPSNKRFFAKRFRFPDLLYQNQVAVNLLVKRSFIKELPLDSFYNDALIGHFEDWELNVCLRLLGHKPKVVGLPVYHYHIHDKGRQLSSVESHWSSRVAFSKVFDRVESELSNKKLRKLLYLQNLKLQDLAQKEHESFDSSLFLKRGNDFLTRVQRVLSNFPCGKFCLRVISKFFYLLSK